MAEQNYNINLNFKDNSSEAKSNVDAMAKSIDKATDSSKNLEQATGSLSTSQDNNKKSIIDRNSALSLADNITGGMIGTIQNLAASTGILTIAQNAFTVATNAGSAAAKVFKIALASTGIGLIIPAVALLVQYLSSFTPIVDKVEQGMAALGSAVRVVQQALFSLVSGDLGGFKTLGSDIGKAATEAARLTKELQDLEDALEIQSISNKRFTNEYNTLIRASKDLSKTEQERAAFLDKANKLAEGNQSKNLAFAAKQIKLAKEAIINDAKLTKEEAIQLEKRGLGYKEFIEGRTNNADKLFDDLKKAQEGYLDILGQGDKKAENAQNKQNALIEKQQAKAEKDREKLATQRIKDAETAKKLKDEEIEYNKTSINNLNKLQISLFEDSLTRKIAEIEEEERLAIEAENERFNAYKENHKITEEELQCHKDTLQAITDNANVKAKEVEKNDREEKKIASDEYFAAEADKAIARTEDQKKLDDEVLASKQVLTDVSIGFAETLSNAIGSFAGKNKGFAIAMLAVEKAFAISQIIVGASRSIALAKANLAAVPAFIGVAPNPAYAGQAIATAKGILSTKLSAAASIASIAAATISQARGINSGGGDSGDSSASSRGNTPASTAPTTRFVSSGNNQLASTIAGQTQQQTQALQQQPIKAYVTTKDINTGQELERNAVNNTTIG